MPTWVVGRRTVLAARTRLSIAGRSFGRGLGTHTVGWLGLELHRSARRFTGLVGVDDVVGRQGWGRVRFLVRGDGRMLYDSGVMNGGEAARSFDLDRTGIGLLELISDAPGDNTHHGHADWCETVITYQGRRPETVARPRSAAVLLTPSPSSAPRFVAGWLLAMRPGAPVLWTLPCLGEGPLHFAVEGLPDSLHLDPESGILSGFAPFAGRHPVRLTATNVHGSTHRVLTLLVGEELAATPPMGWSSWNCCHTGVSETMVRANAAALMDAGLHRLCYRFVNIDDSVWTGPGSCATSGRTATWNVSLRASVWRFRPTVTVCCGYDPSIGPEDQRYPAACSRARPAAPAAAMRPPTMAMGLGRSPSNHHESGITATGTPARMACTTPAFSLSSASW